MPLEVHDRDCPPCQANQHRQCMESDEFFCDCAEGGHL